MGKEDAILNEKIRGMIVPPPETKKLIDKAAQLVAKYGSSVQATLKNDEKNLPKFSFFNEGDPYRAYFDQRVNEVIKKEMNDKEDKFLGRKTTSEVKTESSSFSSNINPLNSTKRHSSIQEDLKKMIEEKQAAAAYDVRPPPQDQFTISHPNIPAVDMDIIKCTAQFVARNGQRFLTGLSERESKNPQFDFLKPQHTLFGYFTYLVESYAKCLRVGDLNKLASYSKDRELVLKRARDRFLWEKKMKEAQKKKDSIDEQERNQMAQIDWYDFAIVEVIEFTEEEMFNTIQILDEAQFAGNAMIDSLHGNVVSLMQMNGLGESELKQEKQEKHLEKEEEHVNKLFEEMKQENELVIQGNIKTETISEISIKSITQKEDEFKTNPIVNTNEKIGVNISTDLPEPGMKIVKNYVRKPEQATKSENIKCPLCKESVGLEDWPHHIKVELLDPKWKEIQKEVQERKTEVNLAPTGEFLNYLSDFSKYRPDLFGDTKDVVKNAEKKKIEPKPQSTIWDGYAPHLTRTSANIAMLAQQTKKNYEESRKGDGGQMTTQEEKEESESVQFRGFSTNVTLQANAIPISVTRGNPQLSSNATANKLNISETDSVSKLIPEDIFLKKHPKIFKLNVKLPTSETLTTLKGQIIAVTVNPQDTISHIKSNIISSLNINNSEVSDMSRIISFDGEEMDELKTAAFYNLSHGAIIEFRLI